MEAEARGSGRAQGADRGGEAGIGGGALEAGFVFVETGGAVDEVGVGVDEAGNDNVAGGVEDFGGAGGGEVFDAGGGADLEEAAVLDEHGGVGDDAEFVHVAAAARGGRPAESEELADAADEERAAHGQGRAS